VPKDSFGSAIYRLMTPTPAYKPNLASIRPLQEFIFEYKRQNDTLVPTDFLALAQLRIDTGDLAAALDLLRQLTLQHVSNYENGAMTFPVPGQPEFEPDQPARINYSPSGEAPNPYINTDYAASLLEKDHHPAEAIPFLQALVKSVPWDVSYRFRLAQAQLASNARDLARTNFTAVARDTSAPYDLRVQAARALAPLTSQTTELGSRELSFIAHPSTVAAARQPYSAEARITAAAIASTSTSDRELLLREAIAIAPVGPNADRARIDIFLQQPATADPSASLAILGALQNTVPKYRRPPIIPTPTQPTTLIPPTTPTPCPMKPRPSAAHPSTHRTTSRFRQQACRPLSTTSTRRRASALPRNSPPRTNATATSNPPLRTPRSQSPSPKIPRNQS
jgi:hypothetical protein